MEIKLSDLLGYCIEHWKVIFLCTAAFALLGFTYAKLKNKDAVDVVFNLDSYVDSTDEEERRSLDLIVERYEAQDKLIAIKRNYLDKSLLMNIDPGNVCKLTTEYLVCVDEVSQSDVKKIQNYLNIILNHYESEMKTEDYLKQLAEEIDTEPQYIREVLSLSHIIPDYTTDSISSSLTGNGISSEGVRIEGYFTIQVTGASLEACRTITEYLTEHMDDIDVSSLADITGLQFSYVSETENHFATQDYQNTRINYLREIQTALSDRDGLLSGLTGDDANYVYAQLGMETSIIKAYRVSVKKYLLLGAAAGLFLSLLYLAVHYIFEGKIQNRGFMENNYGVREYAISSEESNRNDPICRLGRRLRKGSARQYTLEQAITLLLAAPAGTETSEDEEGNSEVCIAGTNLNAVQPFAQMLQKLLEERGIKVKTGENISEDPEWLMSTTETTTFILLEKSGSSSVTALDREVAFLEEHKADVLGAIFVM